MRQLTSLDAQFLAIESATTTGHVGGLAIFDPSTAPGGAVTLEDVLAMFRERLHLLPPLRWRLEQVPLGLDRPYWIEDPDFELEFHVRELALPAPGDDAQLAEQVARISSRHLDRARPLWECYLIHGLPDGHFAIQTKMHHAMIDGMSGAEIMGIMFDLAPEGREFADTEPASWIGDRVPGQLEMLGRGVAALPLQPLRMARAAPGVLPHLDVAPSVFGVPGAETMSRTLSKMRNIANGTRDGDVLERPKMRAPRTSFNGKISPHRRFSFGSLSLPAVKALKKAYGVTVNDVVVTLTTSAIRDWLIAHDELPEDPLLAQIPVSVRTDEERGTFGNKISIMIAPLATHIADPVERLRFTHEAMKAAKDRHRALPAKALQDITAFIPPAINARAARVALQMGTRQGMRPLYNVVISNVPGPPIPIYMAGAQLQHNYPVSVVTDGAGLNVTVLSYLDHLDFGLIADRDQMPDLQTLMDGLRTALADLEAALPA
ncbi:Putative diacylglycerol O-acyltransferase [Paraconexibacter sp. AEG42_29]|uniref:Diacylglycerol O-acyltransferase n=1 Tax=Paraconexibacter sp. AEG42_29 TaxID=2997339 RepID=A0AAU7AVW8_9ACTN